MTLIALWLSDTAQFFILRAFESPFPICCKQGEKKSTTFEIVTQNYYKQTSNSMPFLFPRLVRIESKCQELQKYWTLP